MTPPWLRVFRDAVTIEVVARPGASRSGFHRVTPQGVVIGINAAPEKGKANAELIGFVAKALGLTRSSITILKGESSRHKTIRIESASPSGLANQLEQVFSPSQSGE